MTTTPYGEWRNDKTLFIKILFCKSNDKTSETVLGSERQNVEDTKGLK